MKVARDNSECTKYLNEVMQSPPDLVRSYRVQGHAEGIRLEPGKVERREAEKQRNKPVHRETHDKSFRMRFATLLLPKWSMDRKYHEQKQRDMTWYPGSDLEANSTWR